MKKNILGKTNLSVSPVVFGGIINMDETQQDADRYTAFAVERGINYFDVAPSYGNAQERLGRALLPYRKDVYLACKTTERLKEGAERELHESLKALNTDHFDVYQLHSMTNWDDVEKAFSKDGAMEVLLRAKRDGIIRNIGFSAHSEEVALKCLDLYPFDTVLFPMNWSMGINAGWGDRISERAKTDGFGLLAMKTLILRLWDEGEERLFPKSWCKPVDDEALGIAAMKYGLHKGAHTLVPPGNFHHFTFMLDHIDACQNALLTDAEWKLLRDTAKTVDDRMIFPLKVS